MIILILQLLYDAKVICVGNVFKRDFKPSWYQKLKQNTHKMLLPMYFLIKKNIPASCQVK